MTISLDHSNVAQSGRSFTTDEVEEISKLYLNLLKHKDSYEGRRNSSNHSLIPMEYWQSEIIPELIKAKEFLDVPLIREAFLDIKQKYEILSLEETTTIIELNFKPENYTSSQSNS